MFGLNIFKRSKKTDEGCCGGHGAGKGQCCDGDDHAKDEAPKAHEHGGGCCGGKGHHEEEEKDVTTPGGGCCGGHH